MQRYVFGIVTVLQLVFEMHQLILLLQEAPHLKIVESPQNREIVIYRQKRRKPGVSSWIIFHWLLLVIATIHGLLSATISLESEFQIPESQNHLTTR